MSAVPAIPVNPSLSQRWGGLGQAQRLRIGLGLVLFIAIGVIGIVMGRQAEWRVLYSSLADKDGGAIVAQLTQMNIPYKHSEGGGAILVPADKVYDTRLRLASLGLPKGAVAGFETLDANRFGMTQFQERLAFQRGLEGELTRSIQALSSVQSARVHLALPNQNGFFREQQKPSASILVSLNAGRTLDRTQLAGIIHLVSSSVPEMNPAAVSVLDDSGKLLSTPPEGVNGLVGGGMPSNCSMCSNWSNSTAVVFLIFWSRWWDREMSKRRSLPNSIFHKRNRRQSHTGLTKHLIQRPFEVSRRWRAPMAASAGRRPACLGQRRINRPGLRLRPSMVLPRP